MAKKYDDLVRQNQSFDLLNRHAEFLAGNRCGRGTWREKAIACMRHACVRACLRHVR